LTYKIIDPWPEDLPKSTFAGKDKKSRLLKGPQLKQSKTILGGSEDKTLKMQMVFLLLLYNQAMPSKTIPIYQIKISLNHIRPSIWRRFLVPANIYLAQLHDVLQTIMGWSDYHLHQFIIQGKNYGDPQDDEFGELGMISERYVRLKQVVPTAGERFEYDYDFGDSWHHTLVVEQILPPDPRMRHPVCLEGKRACPPEDVGGIGGYANFLEAIRHPRHEEHAEYLEWVGGSFDPEMIDLDEINRRLRKLKKPGALGVEDWSAWPEFPPRIQPPPDPAWLEKFNRQYQKVADALIIRRDMVVLLQYLRDHRVTGTQATGSLPLKAAEEVGALFVKPVSMKFTFGNFSYPVRSSAEIWPLLFLQILASAGGLITGGPGKRWRVTPLSEEFLQASPGVQAWSLFHTWWSIGELWRTMLPRIFPPPACEKMPSPNCSNLPPVTHYPFQPSPGS
jgi:hypothetical protein